uniref:J domain-containing protein n=1 Tax=viral metagenome TaxID=1070528 RepID=A0A6C0HLZ6_9ZZZZ
MGNDNSKATIENQQLIMQLQQQILQNTNPQQHHQNPQHQQHKQNQQHQQHHQNPQHQQNPQHHQNPQHQQNPQQPNNFINNILQNKKILAQIENNPIAKRKLLEKLLNEYRHLMTSQQTLKITEILNTLPPAQNSYTPNSRFSNPQNIAAHEASIPANMAFNSGTVPLDTTSRALQAKQQFTDTTMLKTHYRTELESEEAEYKRAEQQRRAEFLERQRLRRSQYQAKLIDLENNDIDAVKLFQLPAKYSLEQLKAAYKKLAMKSHPDRPNGNKEQFQLVTKCYMLLLEKYKNRESDRTFDDLRKGSKKYIEDQADTGDKPKYLDKNKFDLKMFNKIYEGNKLWDSNDDGYGDFMKSEKGESEAPTELFGNKFNLNVFNSTFEDHKERIRNNNDNKMQINEYKEPQELVSCATGFTDIDVFSKKIGDFSKPLPIGSNKNELAYTDLKTAYTGRGAFIDPSKVEYTAYKSVDELKRVRENVSYDMTPDEMAHYETRKQREAEEEETRQQRIRERDNVVTSTYSRLHERMLGYKGSAPA